MKTLIPNTLLEVGDSYVYASWVPEGSDEQVLAILRDSDRNGSWALEQFRGPFSKVIKGRVFNDTEHALFEPAALLAVDMHSQLNASLTQTKKNWAGKLYDR